MLNGQTLNDHVTQPIKGLRKINSDIFSTEEKTLVTKTKRVANSSIVSNSTGNNDRLKGVSKPTFWQLAPDGVTIERVFEGPEPLDIKRYQK